MRHLVNAQYVTGPAGGNTGRLFLLFGRPIGDKRISNCPLGRMYVCNKECFLEALSKYDETNSNAKIFTDIHRCT